MEAKRTYLVQKNVHTFSQYHGNLTCKLCKQQEEDIFHMLLHCPLLREIRIFKRRCYKLHWYHSGSGKDSFSAKEDIIQLIIDCRKFSHLFDDEEIVRNIEKLSRNQCYKLLYINVYMYLSYETWKMTARDMNLHVICYDQGIFSACELQTPFHTFTNRLSRLRGCSYRGGIYRSEEGQQVPGFRQVYL